MFKYTTIDNLKQELKKDFQNHGYKTISRSLILSLLAENRKHAKDKNIDQKKVSMMYEALCEIYCEEFNVQDIEILTNI